MSQEQILQRLNALEEEVQSLRNQLQSQPPSLVVEENNQDKGAYITAGIGFLEVSDVTEAKQTPGSSTFETTSFDGDWSGEFGLGYRFNKNLRGEITYIVNTTLSASNRASGYWDPTELDTFSSFASIYYDFANDSDFTPYLATGLGATYINYNYYSAPNETTLGYHFKGGVSYELSQATDLFLEGIFQSTKSFDYRGNVMNPLDMYSARLGTRYKF